MPLADLERWKNKIVNLGLVILALVIASNIYKAQTKEIDALSQRKDSETKKISLLKEIAQWEGRLSASKNFINNKEISSVMNTVSDIAESASVRITSIKPAGIVDYSLYTKYPYSLTVLVDGYHTLGKFISKLESHADIYSVDSAIIRRQTTKQDGKTYKMAVDLVISTVLMKN